MVTLDWTSATPRTARTERMLSALLDLLEGNPYSQGFERMNFTDQTSRESTYDRTLAIEVLLRGQEPQLELSVTRPHSLRVLMHFNPNGLFMFLQTVPAVLSRPGMAARTRSYLKQVNDLLPNSRRACADARANLESFDAQYPFLPTLPNLLGRSLQWYLLLAPQAYTSTYTREALLNAPAYAAREDERGWIELLTYEDPLSYSEPATEQRIVELTRYLDAQRRDRPAPSAP